MAPTPHTKVGSRGAAHPPRVPAGPDGTAPQDSHAVLDPVAAALRGVARRPVGSLYRPSRMSRWFGWIGDAVALLDPTPALTRAGTALAPLSNAFGGAMEAIVDRAEVVIRPRGGSAALRAIGTRVGLLMAPVAEGIDRGGSELLRVHRRLARAAEGAIAALPMPSLVREVLWLEPEARPGTGSGARPSMQARMKGWYAPGVWVSLIASVALHALAFGYSPTFQADDFSFEAVELTSVEVPPEVEVPPPPAAVARPATPVISALPLEEDLTIAPTTFADNPVDELPPPPGPGENARDDAAGANPSFTPFTVAPEIRNRDELVPLITRAYPPTLRDAGIGGVVVVWFYIDESGSVVDTRIAQSSGFPGLDEAALRVSDQFVFSPALLNDRHVPVWVQFPITFAVR